MAKQEIIEDYDSEPVTYCSRCYSLNIVHEDTIGLDYCKECGCSDLKTSSIDEWEKLYEGRFGHRFVTENKDIRRSPIFLLSNDKLKVMLSDSPSWRRICKTLYPTFPDWLNKADSIILLFAKLYQDSRLDELRIEMMKLNNKH